MDVCVDILCLTAIKQAGLFQGALSQILEMQDTNGYFSRLRTINPGGKKASSCFSYRKEQKHAETSS